MNHTQKIDLKALRDQLSLSDPADMESIGFMRFIMRLSEALNHDLPEQDHSKLVTLRGCEDYLQATST